MEVEEVDATQHLAQMVKHGAQANASAFALPSTSARSTNNGTPTLASVVEAQVEDARSTISAHGDRPGIL